MFVSLSLAFWSSAAADWGLLMTFTYPQEHLYLETKCKYINTWPSGSLVWHIYYLWLIWHHTHLTPRVTCWDFHIWGKLTDISYTLNCVPTSVHTLLSHEHLGNHPEDLFPSITSRIVTDARVMMQATLNPLDIYLTCCFSIYSPWQSV